jgi:hypothetical protein
LHGSQPAGRFLVLQPKVSVPPVEKPRQMMRQNLALRLTVMTGQPERYLVGQVDQGVSQLFYFDERLALVFASATLP